VYDLPSRDEWYDDYEDGRYDLIVCDEFKGNKPIGEMNLFSDGYVTPLKRRGKSPYLKKDILPMIICSNLSPNEVYKKSEDVIKDAFSSRFEVIQIEDPFTVRIELKEPKEPTLEVPQVSKLDEPQEPPLKKQKIHYSVLLNDSDSE